MKPVHSAWVLLSAIICVASGCSPSDPVAELQKAIERYRTVSTAARDFRHDVRKTDSLVSPYVGTVVYTYEWKDEQGKVIGSVECTASFAYQDKHWVGKHIDVAVSAFDDNDRKSLRDLDFQQSQEPKEVTQWQDALSK